MTARQRHHLRTLYVQRTRRHPRPCCVVNVLVRAPRRRRSRWARQDQMGRAVRWGDDTIDRLCAELDGRGGVTV